MHLYKYSNQSSHNAEFSYKEDFAKNLLLKESESVLLQEIRKIQMEENQMEENQQEYVKENLFPEWFFGMNRDDGGYARFECMGIRLPLSLDITYLVWIIVFLVPVIGFCLIIPALRKKACESFIVVMMFSSTGLALITGLLTTSWLVGEVEGKMTIGPLRTRCNTRVGMWIGLSTVNITLEKSQMYLNEIISIDDSSLLIADQKHAMQAGWPWPLLLVIEYLAGQEKNWTGTLGFYLNRAGRSVYVVLYFSIFLWIIWMFCFTIATHLACKPLILSGLLELLSVIVYAIQIYVYIVPYVILEGNKLNLSFGWSWWFTLFLGCFHVICGVLLYVYDYFRPGKLYTIFERDFDLPTHRLSIKKYNSKLGIESPIVNGSINDGYEEDDFESSSYQSFHHPHDIHPSPDALHLSPGALHPIPDALHPSPDLLDIKQILPTEDVAPFQGPSPVPSHLSTQNLLPNMHSPMRNNSLIKSTRLFQQHSTPHKIFVH